MNDIYHGLHTPQLQYAATSKTWIWHGLLGLGTITLFTSMWKAGKTTLLAHLLAQRRQGGELAGLAVSAGATAVVTEEAASIWFERHKQLTFGDRDVFFCRPFVATPTNAEWEAFIEHLRALHERAGVDLVIIDPLANFLPGGENHAALLLDALRPLRKLADAGLAVLLVHHPSKDAVTEGAASRGSGLLPAFVDVLVEMYRLCPDDNNDRRRRLVGFSRDPATPRSLLIELNGEGTGFAVVAPPVAVDLFEADWAVLRLVLENARRELSREELLKQWPPDYPAPKETSLRETLAQAHERGLVSRIGAGLRGDPYRYFLPEKMEAWKDDAKYVLTETLRNRPKMPWEEGYQPK